MARLTLTWIIMMLQGLGEGLKCFKCDNLRNSACGVNFKSYQFPPENCPGFEYKCGLQRQSQRGDYIGIIRDCYKIGSLQMEDESDKCHQISSEDNSTSFLLCLCSEDFCNIASRTSTCSYIMIVISLVLLLGLVQHHHVV
ncbi:uncharacterized protein LOC132749864 [Ruditapes philippinarum]|uniref:uncharacterized protein LOC132749864 n=1 Tax=Ruditapes philippinarum TaxID=129788 RepID=UPI00295B212C|nr:uncharacterized protein LOC132749864 [Ruditapes philippinarum]